ncbi:MAG: hypothetical protein QM780_03210 [Hyphomicrobium sp.]|uniref:hypothetical protein n=1 Tax=Hyphomicrobium sp. TaxID=82 RepID=UPI0039E47FE9
MASDPTPEMSELKGALDVLFTLREEFATWVEEAQDGERKEELDNVYQHVLAMEEEYQRRLAELQKKSEAPS